MRVHQSHESACDALRLFAIQALMALQVQGSGASTGKLFGNKFTHERYLQLDDINLSPEEMAHEENTICKSIQERLALANQHRYKTESFEVLLSMAHVA